MPALAAATYQVRAYMPAGGNIEASAPFIVSTPMPIPGISPMGLGLMAGLFVIAAFWALRRMGKQQGS